MIKRSLIRLICLLTMLSGAGLLSSCASSKAATSSPAATATPVATATPAVTTYTSADGQYTLQYPASWRFKLLSGPNTSGIVQFSDSSANDQLLVLPLTVHAANSYPALLKDGLSNPANFQNTKVEATTHTVSYPSGVWTVASATTALFGEPYTVLLYGIVHSGRTVLIETYAPSSSATGDQTTYFAPMLTSFTFLK
jgi:hypothetical protein